MFFRKVITCVVICMQTLPSGALECFSCSNTPRITDCSTVVNCPIDSACSSTIELRNGTRFYTLGCRDAGSCPSIGGSSTWVGRSVPVTPNCFQCCHNNNCNRQLCQDQDPQCADDQQYDCAKFGAITNICDETSHIKPYCRRFCGFCNTLDGDWSPWSEWSLCDVTCGNGTQTKSRSCSDPPPTNGGRNCVGDNLQHKPCSRDMCPVHRSWSRWSDWQSCSVSCDIGLQRRERTCSNPAPARGGDYCNGDSKDYTLCSPGACTNGSWSTWEAWGACSQSCDAGLRKRSRHCNNPVPSLTGQDCVGDAIDSQVCNSHVSCQGPVVFYAWHPSTYSPGPNATLRFTYVSTNVGNAYNSTTGYFTAPVYGTYSFSVQVCTHGDYYTGVGLFVNDGKRYQNLQSYGSSDTYARCRTMTVAVLLKQWDKVNVRTDRHTSTKDALAFGNDWINSFSGALVMRF